MRRLGNAEIVAALAGRSIAYAPPGWADAGGYEEFSAGGFWRGTHLGRGPMHFSGRWKVDGGRLCVTARRIRPNHRWGHGPVCRAVWRDRRNAGLLTEHFAIGTPGLLRLQLGPVRNPSS